MRSRHPSSVTDAYSDSNRRAGLAIASRPQAPGAGAGWWQRTAVALVIASVLAGTSVAALHADDDATGVAPAPTVTASPTATPTPVSTPRPEPAPEPAATEAATTEPIAGSELPPEAVPTGEPAQQTADRLSVASLAPRQLDETALSLLNQARTAAGLPELVLSDEARFVAAERALDMAANGYFAHVSPWGVGAVKLLADFDIPHQIVGENIARSNYPEEQVVPIVHDALMASPGHRDNILEPRFRRAGIAVARAGDMFYFATVFLD